MDKLKHRIQRGKQRLNGRKLELRTYDTPCIDVIPQNLRRSIRKVLMTEEYLYWACGNPRCVSAQHTLPTSMPDCYVHLYIAYVGWLCKLVERERKIEA